jgi:hypothetical protein
MLVFEIEPNYDPTKKNQNEYELSIHFETINKTIRISDVDIPESFCDLERCINKLVQLNNQQEHLNTEELLDSERLQHALSSGLIQAKLTPTGVIYLKGSGFLNDRKGYFLEAARTIVLVNENDEIIDTEHESLSAYHQQSDILNQDILFNRAFDKLLKGETMPPIGVIWYVGENNWPNMGYMPNSKKILFSESSSRNRYTNESWINYPIEIQHFAKGMTDFLSKIHPTQFLDLSKHLYKSLQKLHCEQTLD